MRLTLLVSGSPKCLKHRLHGNGLFVCLWALFILHTAPATAQIGGGDSLRITEPAPTVVDSIVSLQSLRREPRKALLWSIIPGGGQAFNRKWWKVPLVYSGLLGAVAYADFNQTQYTRFVRALNNRCLGDGNVIVVPNQNCVVTEDEFTAVSTSSLRQQRDNADRARQTAYIGILVVYLLQGVEAYTDAHLQEFDISDDISLRLGPVVTPGTAIAYGLAVNFDSMQGRREAQARVRELHRQVR